MTTGTEKQEEKWIVDMTWEAEQMTFGSVEVEHERLKVREIELLRIIVK